MGSYYFSPYFVLGGSFCGASCNRHCNLFIYGDRCSLELYQGGCRLYKIKFKDNSRTFQGL